MKERTSASRSAAGKGVRVAAPGRPLRSAAGSLISGQGAENLQATSPSLSLKGQFENLFFLVPFL